MRYLGYTNELGESFRPLIPRALVRTVRTALPCGGSQPVAACNVSQVNATYGVSGLYVLCDTYDKMNRAKKVGMGRSELRRASPNAHARVRRRMPPQQAWRPRRWTRCCGKALYVISD